MVKFYENSFKYEYPFPAVSLAYFLRYPNPYATHVLSTDVIDRHFDSFTQRLSTTRLHLKRSKVPAGLVKLLPKGILGVGADSGQSYILETSVVDAREGWMRTESRNLEWTGVLSVVEKQVYERRRTTEQRLPSSQSPTSAVSATTSTNLVEHAKNEDTDVTTTVTLLSRFGQSRKVKSKPIVSNNDNNDASDIRSSPISLSSKSSSDNTLSLPHSLPPTTTFSSRPSSTSDEDSSISSPDPSTKKSFFSSWSTTSTLQRTIETLGLRRTREALGRSKEGMNVVLERLRKGGLKQVLDGMQQDRQKVFGYPGGDGGAWKQAWRYGGDGENRGGGPDGVGDEWSE